MNLSRDSSTGDAAVTHLGYVVILKPAKKKLSRAEKKELTYQSLMEAAVAMVAECGYGATSIAKVTEIAGVSQGTFYNYFEDRQAMFDALLPYIGDQMIKYIVSKVPADVRGIDREAARFAAYCAFLSENRGFYRILYEAEVHAPAAHQLHMSRIREGYRRSLRRSCERGEITRFNDDELEALIAILIGARAYVSMQYFDQPEIPAAAVSSYEKLIRSGLFA